MMMMVMVMMIVMMMVVRTRRVRVRVRSITSSFLPVQGKTHAPTMNSRHLGFNVLLTILERPIQYIHEYMCITG